MMSKFIAFWQNRCFCVFAQENNSKDSKVFILSKHPHLQVKLFLIFE